MILPSLSIIIPVYNRGPLIRYTFESIRRAAAGLAVELVVIDDGSREPVSADLAKLGFSADILHRQENQGLLFARLAGLERASGQYTLFLDSDDLISPESLRQQLTALTSAGADVSYTDTARVVVAGDYDQLAPIADPPSVQVADAADLFIGVQPAPHAVMFRTDYLRAKVAQPLFPPSRLYNNIAEVWFYYLSAPHPARIVHVPGPHAIIGQHETGRLTSHWERLGISSLAAMEAFVRSCPSDTAAAQRARHLVGQKAFVAWRRLPRGFSPEFSQRLLAIWQRLGNSDDLAALGGRSFQALAKILGPVSAARVLHRWQAGSFESCRTLPDAEIAALLKMLPPP